MDRMDALIFSFALGVIFIGGLMAGGGVERARSTQRQAEFAAAGAMIAGGKAYRIIPLEERQ